MEYSEICPNVAIYRGVLQGVVELYSTIKESESDANGRFHLREWEKWSIFGKYSEEKNDPSENIEYGKRYDDEKHLSEEVYRAYNIAIDDYIKRYDIHLPENSSLMSSSFCKYDQNVDRMKNSYSMQYHCDYVLPEKDLPGPKFFLTCTTYINDDYEGGEIVFYVNGDTFSHKPKAGDILVFPSSEPYYHGVKSITKGNKFFVRNFVTYRHEGSDEWLQNQKRHGAMVWAEKEKIRISKELKEATLYLVDDQILTYSELLKINPNLK
jgi:hypothetical protein